MAAKFNVGDPVQTPFGKGVVREVRNSGRLLVDVAGRALEVRDIEISALRLDTGRRRSRVHPPARESPSSSVAEPAGRTASREVDLHGLTTEEALGRAEGALNDAMLADLTELRLIHGRSGGRIRAALHRRLREISSIRGFRLDPRNAGVTIVAL